MNSDSNSNNNVYGAFTVASATVKVHPVHCGTSERQLLMLDQVDQLEPQIRLNRHVQHYIHHRHLLLLSPKFDTHFTIPQRVKG